MHSTSTNPYSAYRQTSVATASPDKLLLMLFDGAIRFLIQARVAMEEKNHEATNKWLQKLQDIFMELNLSLDMKQGEVSVNLRKLYEFYQNEVLMANVEKSVERLQPVEDFLRSFRETWAEAARIVNQQHNELGKR
ncbi:flagellar biosynthetic protein FliS [Desulfosporosinus acidiphilus SJ4]|uniref:Flagellar secretion chaperone FliS n=1 Tax=Desulfosporosinus acidiphilus (strain DSM 22704 / JCM 16185 / SJ4) TaxID=646529 RepID=U3GJK5_DESAJ|nr:flagellar export chaperone FliS [Desulfosporosinus acidiphilus]AFM42729.1 flagellar biosynthetic protein FliS [Desulfosporosinus acidiphilus SJ4]